MIPSIVAYCDGGSRGNPGPSACAYAIYNGQELFYRNGVHLGLNKTNNFAEYKGLILLLEYLNSKGISRVIIYCDSELVVNQANQLWKVNKEELKQFAAYAHGLLVRGRHTLMHCDGHAGILGNELVDEIVNCVLDNETY